MNEEGSIFKDDIRVIECYCVNCGRQFPSDKVLKNHLYFQCDIRLLSQIRHSAFITHVSKLCDLDPMEVQNLEQEAYQILYSCDWSTSVLSEHDLDKSLSVKSSVNENYSDVFVDLKENLLNESFLLSVNIRTAELDMGDSNFDKLENTKPVYEISEIESQMRDSLEKQAAQLVTFPEVSIGDLEDEELTSRLKVEVSEVSVENSATYTCFCFICLTNVDCTQIIYHTHSPTTCCGFCNYMSRDVVEMGRHRMTIHVRQPRLPCPLCSLRFHTSHAYIKHLCSHESVECGLIPQQYGVWCSKFDILSNWSCFLCGWTSPRSIKCVFSEVKCGTFDVSSGIQNALSTDSDPRLYELLR